MVILSNEVVWGFLFVGFFGVWVLLGRGIHCHVGGQTNRSSACEIKSIIWLLWRGMEPSQESWAEEEATYLSLLLPPSVRPRRTFKIIQTIMCCVVLCCFWPKEIFPKGDPKSQKEIQWEVDRGGASTVTTVDELETQPLSLTVSLRVPRRTPGDSP